MLDCERPDRDRALPALLCWRPLGLSIFSLVSPHAAWATSFTRRRRHWVWSPQELLGGGGGGGCGCGCGWKPSRPRRDRAGASSKKKERQASKESKQERKKTLCRQSSLVDPQCGACRGRRACTPIRPRAREACFWSNQSSNREGKGSGGGNGSHAFACFRRSLQGASQASQGQILQSWNAGRQSMTHGGREEMSGGGRGVGKKKRTPTPPSRWRCRSTRLVPGEGGPVAAQKKRFSLFPAARLFVFRGSLLSGGGGGSEEEEEERQAAAWLLVFLCGQEEQGWRWEEAEKLKTRVRAAPGWSSSSGQSPYGIGMRGQFSLSLSRGDESLWSITDGMHRQSGRFATS